MRSPVNPEELIAAAHAGCFTMALAFGLQGAGYTPPQSSLSETSLNPLEPCGPVRPGGETAGAQRRPPLARRVTPALERGCDLGRAGELGHGSGL
jgi:hypothetical protein